MKVDFLISNMTGGGAQRVISLIANDLAARSHEIRIISFRGDDEYSLHPSIKRVRFNKKFFFNSVVFNGYFQLFSFYFKKKNRPNVISSHINLLGYLTIPIAKIFGIKIIVSEHINHVVRNDFARRFLWNNLYPMVDAVTILTSFDLNYFSNKNKRVVVMPNPSTFESRIAPENHKRKKEIVTIGSLDRYHHKGFDSLLKIAKIIEEHEPDWKILIVGSGADGRLYLDELINKLKVNNVIFTGQRSDIKEILYNAEIYVLPSRFEGLPMTLLEGMSQGAACIAFDCISGPSDIITDGHDGFLIENQNHDAMASAILRLISNIEIRNRVQKNAPLALKRFSIERVGSKWEKLLEEVVRS